MEQLPTPRFEIRWFSNGKNGCVADYRFVINSPDKLDIRSNDEIECKVAIYEITAAINQTFCRSPIERYVNSNNIDIPFRDGVHICRDADLLNIPAFVTYENKAKKISSKRDENGAFEGVVGEYFEFESFPWRKLDE